MRGLMFWKSVTFKQFIPVEILVELLIIFQVELIANTGFYLIFKLVS